MNPRRGDPLAKEVEIVVLQSLWGFQGSLVEAIERARQHGFDGLEANLCHPALAGLEPAVVAGRLAVSGLALMLELVTGGDYVPDLALSP